MDYQRLGGGRDHPQCPSYASLRSGTLPGPRVPKFVPSLEVSGSGVLPGPRVPKFVHLHVASCFSVHYGTAWPEALVEAQGENQAAGLTDKDGVYGAVRHIRTCLATGVAPVVGADLLLDDGSEITVLGHGHDHGYGWACLCRLISAAHGRTVRRASGSANRAAKLTRRQITGILTGGDQIPVTVLLGPKSDVGRAILAGDTAAAARDLAAWQALLPGGVTLEIVCHYTRPGVSASVPHAAAMLNLGLATSTPAVLTNAVRYLTPGDAVTGDVLDAAGYLQPLGAFQPQTNAQAWLKPASVMKQVAIDVVRYATQPDHLANQLLEASLILADRCALDPDADLGWRRPKVPELDLLGLDGDPRQVLTQRCRAGLPKRWPNPSPKLKRQLLDRLDDELRIIHGFDFDAYFLVVADIVDMIKAMGVRVQARGSGAGSLVNYLLGVSRVDPIEYDLLFERFLGIQRSTLPDIDIDVESERRHEIYRAVTSRYGPHRVTLLSMQNQYRARSAVRDAGLALGLDPAEIDLVAKSLWRINACDITQALEQRPEAAELARDVANKPQLQVLVDLSQCLDRLPRYIAMHPCGMIISDQNLLSLTPTQPSGLGLGMSQFDKDDIDDLGLLKLDILGVRMQSTLAYALQEIHRTSAQRIDLDQIPYDDPATYESIQSTNTLGMFQIESPGQRELVGKLQPESMTDLVADISLFRPGPVKGNMIVPFLESRFGFRSTTVLHPRFRQVLADSHGVVIYHEHVLRILSDCMGISLAEADEVRRQLSEGTKQVEVRFRQLAASRIDEQGRRLFNDHQIDRIWTTLKQFGSFGFCKAHAASFATTTYESAWLKTHFPAEFMAAVLEYDPGMYPKRLLLNEAKRMGIPILGIDANASGARHRVEPFIGRLGIRLSFSEIKGISTAEVRRLVANQPYTSITDVLVRAKPHRTTARYLAEIGAFDGFDLADEPVEPTSYRFDPTLVPPSPKTATRRSDIIAWVRRLSAKHQEPPLNQNPLIAEDGSPTAGIFTNIPEDCTLPTTETGTYTSAETGTRDIITTEMEVLGLDVTGHLLDPWRSVLEDLGVTPANQLCNLRNNSTAIVAGVRVACQTPPTKSGQRVVFLSLDDGTGVADVAFFPDAQSDIGPDLFHARLLAVRGKTRRTGARGISLTADAAWDFTRSETRLAAGCDVPMKRGNARKAAGGS